MEKVSAKTIADKQSVCELMLRILGDKPIDQYSREDARKFKEVALQLPPRMGQLPKRSIDSMINGAEDTISPTTFNNYVKNLTTVFTHAVREEYCQKNPLEGLKINLRGKVSEQRARYTNEELKKLFEGIKSAKQDDRKPYREWLPLLGLYTGARLNELCQLYLDDVAVINGIHCLHIRALKSDQKLKNTSSERIIPIHTKLFEAGFLEFVEKQRSLGAERLFPELSLHKRNGYGHIPSRWFAGVRDKLGLKGGDEKKDFHSFRHTVADHLKQLGVTESLVGALLGHSTGGVTFGRYGKDYEPEKLVEVVERLRFDSLWP
ncbi:site-specific integrase [Neptuniibacter sp. CAU 1671]|uniref:site-specific integrase n=1 Tax=Neptuniibacter sp. CAU 1671 TaxID=3032593 RepID=UPI0023DB4E55|nr:site-specific integrase [Neptuniibacter sp. CAU 1671]MDF2182840.1 site-specific integrase [Neptuniibacter sp. CAU 1671]